MSAHYETLITWLLVYNTHTSRTKWLEKTSVTQSYSLFAYSQKDIDQIYQWGEMGYLSRISRMQEERGNLNTMKVTFRVLITEKLIDLIVLSQL